MAKTAERERMVVTPIALTDELAAMSNYVRSLEGRAAIERGIADIHQGRTIEGTGVLAVELTARAIRRRS